MARNIPHPRYHTIYLDVVGRALDKINTAWHRLRGKFFLSRVKPVNADVNKVLKSAIEEQILNMNEVRLLKMNSAEFRACALQIYKMMNFG